MAWFFLTPVLFPMEIIPAHMRPLFQLNPAAWLIEAYRDLFFYGNWPNWLNLVYLAVGSIVFLLLSIILFERFQRRVAEEI
jgi:ABC-2 type transport system permease protein